MDFDGFFKKTHKNSYTRPLCITGWEYRGHTKKYRVLISFYRKLVIFCKTVG
jgi:hypothetical protein